ncbi:MAG TPA: hypothetical protein VMW52_03805 [Phycisphaerae bacterium]|nr:hypothetical protein [Phycisphaerae bacterium]
MGGKLGRKRLILISAEDPAGDPVAGATHVLAFEPKINPDDTFERREPGVGSAGNFAGAVGQRSGKCSFSAELRSDGIDALDPGLELLFTACGLDLTTKVYSPESAVDSQVTLTIDVYEDGLMKRIYGAAGELKIVGENGKRVMCEFEFSGIWAAPEDAELPPMSVSPTLPMRMASAQLAIDGYTPKAGKVTVALGNTVGGREDVNAASGFAQFYVGDRDVSITLDPEAEPVTGDGAHDAYGVWLDGTEAAFSMVLADADVTVTIEAPKLQYRQVAEGDRGKLMTHELTGQANVDNGDDELTITTAAIPA